ncbi:type II secretion system protein [Cellulomonas taurus]|uniref:type II secretion system protein n=1 Tax=Cellulomonas taurus TaxID=2729175 RepID=UPI00145FA1B3|nr:type II secretion system protein [Cellulomonas taurus]
MTPTTDEESGFSLAEVLVAITLAGILLAVLAPLVIGTVVATGKMTTIASATQLAAAGTDVTRASLRSGTANCASLVSAGPAKQTSTDQRGVQMRRTVTVTGACTSRSTATVDVQVVVVGSGGLFKDGQRLATTSTKVYVP